MLCNNETVVAQIQTHTHRECGAVIIAIHDQNATAYRARCTILQQQKKKQ